jgi:biotin operon repressor
MLFKDAVLRRIAEGEVTLAFRRWSRPTVRAGGTLRRAAGVLAIERIDAVAPADITAEDARKAGYATRDALLRDLARGGRGSGASWQGGDSTALYRIAFRRLGADPREALRGCDALDDRALAAVAAALRRLDDGAVRGGGGTWTLAVLRRIAAAGEDGVAAADIAAALGLDKARLKARILRLKEHGLTESLATGYRLSQRGRAVLSWLDGAGGEGAR